MVTRKEIVRVLGRLAFAAELRDDKRARAWTGAAWAIRQLDEDLSVMVQERRLTSVKGVGPSTASLVSDLLDGIRPRVIDEMEAEVPEGLFEIRTIKGLGSKKIKTLWQELGITSIGELEYACRENRLVELKGFGHKTQTRVIEQLAAMRANAGKRRRDRAADMLTPLAQGLRDSGVRAQIVGDLPRGKELVEDMGIVVSGAATVEETAGVQIHHCDDDHWGWQCLRLTAHPDHVRALQARASSRSVDLDSLCANDEEAVYAALGLSPTPAERREPGVPLVEVGTVRPALVRREDLRGALHNHTTASDGSHSLVQMREAAAAAGLAYLGITEHSVSAFYAGGLNAHALVAQADAIRALNESDAGCVLLTGVESDILADGKLDYADAVLADLEVVVASVHGQMRQDAPAMTARMVSAASHPCTSVIGHPTGRLLLGRKPAAFDMGALLDACATSGCAIELNANPARLDLNETHLAMAKERGVLVSIAADAHSMAELSNLEHGVAIARRAGLTPADVLNCLPLEDLREWLTDRGV